MKKAEEVTISLNDKVCGTCKHCWSRGRKKKLNCSKIGCLVFPEGRACEYYEKNEFIR
jgi:hypothetical protein